MASAVTGHVLEYEIERLSIMSAEAARTCRQQECFDG